MFPQTVQEASFLALLAYAAGELDRAEVFAGMAAEHGRDIARLIRAETQGHRSHDPARAELLKSAQQVLQQLRHGAVLSFAEHGEDVMLARLFRDRPQGFYVDAGANHPLDDSVTALFYGQGWRGVNLEPSAHCLPLLQAWRPRDVTLGVAVGATPGELPFLDLHSGLATLDPGLMAKYSEQTSRLPRPVPVRTLADICAELAPPEGIDFLKIDVEGFEAEALAGADFTRFRPLALVVEATRPLTRMPNWDKWEPDLLAQGYLFVWFDGYNRFYLREEDRDLAEHFAVPPCKHDDFVPIREFRLALSVLLLALQERE